MSTIQSFTYLFQYCSKNTDDPYWKTIFSNASQGKLPTGYSLRDGQLCYRHKKRPDKILLPTDDQQLFYDVCMMFFKKTSGLISDKEKTTEHNKVGDDYIIPSKWTEYKIVSQKKALQDLFISSLSKKYSLNYKEQKNLEHTIIVGMTLKSFKEVKLDEYGFIEELTGLYFDEKTRIFYFEKPKTKLKKHNESILYQKIDSNPQDNNLFLKEWLKFIKTITKTEKSLQQSIYEKLSGSISVSTPMIIE
jgi:hypothetical protein